MRIINVNYVRIYVLQSHHKIATTTTAVKGNKLLEKLCADSRLCLNENDLLVTSVF